jgi:hypothetical protein
VSKYIQWEQFTSEDFPKEEQFVADAHHPQHSVSNRVGHKVEMPSRVYPPDAIFMSTGSQFTVLRWVAPADGNYLVSGRTRAADTSPHGPQWV